MASTEDVLAVRGHDTGTGQLFIVYDYLGQPIFSVPPAGGAAMYGDNFRVFNGGDIFNPVVKLRPDGTVMAAKGDPAGGAGVLTVGNATTKPTAQPDGTGTPDGATTNPGSVFYSVAGRPYVMSQSGSAEELNTPSLRRVMSWYKDIGLTTVTTVGCPGVSLTGTATNADGPLASGFVNLQSAASTPSPFGVSPASYSQAYMAWAPMFWTRIQLDPTSVTNVRYWVGMFSADPASVSALGTISGIGFRYDTSVDGTTFWRIVASNGSGSTVSTTSSSVTAATTYDLRVEVNNANTSVRYLVNEQVVGTLTTNLPAYNTLLGPAVRGNTLSTTAKGLRFGKAVFSHVG